MSGIHPLMTGIQMTKYRLERIKAMIDWAQEQTRGSALKLEDFIEEEEKIQVKNRTNMEK